MRRLIRADLRRILRLKMVYICAILLGVTYFFIYIEDLTINDIMSFSNIMLSTLGFFIISIPIFIGLFGEDFKSGSMQCAIGHGLTRSKLILAKYMDSLVLAALFLVWIYFVNLIKCDVFDMHMTQRQNHTYIINLIFMWIKFGGYLAFTMPFIYFTLNASFGIIFNLFFVLILPNLLQSAQSYFDIPIYDYMFTGLLTKSEALYIVGRNGWMVMPAIVIFIGGSLFVTSMLFSRKEMDF